MMPLPPCKDTPCKHRTYLRGRGAHISISLPVRIGNIQRLLGLHRYTARMYVPHRDGGVRVQVEEVKRKLRKARIEPTETHCNDANDRCE